LTSPISLESGAISLLPPAPGVTPPITADQAVQEASKWESLDDAAAVFPVLATMVRQAPLPVDPVTDQPLSSPSMMNLLVWDVEVKGLCANGPAGPPDRASVAPGGCQWNGAHILISATSGEFLGEALVNFAS
jgi:hypothetical protein